MQAFKKEHLGVRLVRYPDHSVKVAYMPGGRHRQSGVPSQDEQKKNREKNKRFRDKKAVNLVASAARCAAANSGVFITVTSAGVPGNHEEKIKRLIYHLKRKYGLIAYVWVRELTRSGLVHWHMAAVFKKRGMSWVNYMKAKDKSGVARIVQLSDWWAEMLGAHEKYGNSIRLGWKYRNGKPTRFTLDKDAAGYLVKYLIKSFKEEKRVRRFGTNLDFLRPVRFDLIRLVPLCQGFTGGIQWLPVEEDEIRMNEYGLLIDYPEEMNREPDRLLVSEEGFFVEVWFLKQKNYRIRLIQYLN